MKFQRFLTAGCAAVIASSVLTGCFGDDNPAVVPTSGMTITTLSNRADLISGGMALVEIKTPGGMLPATLKIDRDGTDITAAFAQQAGGRILGMVTGLKNGNNVITAKTTDGTLAGAQLVINNHPINGPVLLSAQTGPWVCATPTTVAAVGDTPGSNASGLSTTATDVQCTIATEYKLWYRTKTVATVNFGADGGCQFVLPDPSPAGTATPANSCLQPYVTGTTPAASVASTTTSHGVTLPYIVRVERGTLNRGIYDIAVLFDPTKPTWTAINPQPQWNGKLLYTFGASTGQPRQQFRSEQNWVVGFTGGTPIWDDSALRAGFMVADNSITDSLYNSNRILVAETTMMMKEHIVNSYGEIKYTMGNGCSGGSIQQNTVASTYPGLLDGIQVSCDYPDSITIGIEVGDCTLLMNFYVKPEWTALQTGQTAAQINAKKAAINGHRDQLGCGGWVNSFGYNNRPGNYAPTFFDSVSGAVTVVGPTRNNCKLPAALVYDPVTNPTGTRCGDPDLAAAVWGTTTGLPGGTSKRALTTTDNLGVQYGLKALLASTISPEEFVTLNEKIGGTDVDSTLTAARSVADTAALTIAYQAGIVSSGKNLGKVAIIDWRGYDEGVLPTSVNPIHYNWRSFQERARLDADASSHANQVIWRYGTSLLPTSAAGIAAVTTFSFTTMDTWLSSLITSAPKATMNAVRTQAQVVTGKPAAAVDFCYLTADVNFATKITDQALCDADTNLKFYTSPHQVAGGPQTENILKCTLKPLLLTDYTGITFTAGQQTRLNAVFPSGVCDWSKAGVGQVDPISPLTFQAGPGGVALPAEPTSTPI